MPPAGHGPLGVKLGPMTPDPESSWPLTGVDTGYFPGPTPNPGPAPAPNMMPLTNPSPMVYPPMAPPSRKGMSAGLRLAYVAVILGAAIPLTAIAGSMIGFFGMLLVWVGIIAVAFIALGPQNHSN